MTTMTTMAAMAAAEAPGLTGGSESVLDTIVWYRLKEVWLPCYIKTLDVHDRALTAAATKWKEGDKARLFLEKRKGVQSTIELVRAVGNEKGIWKPLWREQSSDDRIRRNFWDEMDELYKQESSGQTVPKLAKTLKRSLDAVDDLLHKLSQQYVNEDVDDDFWLQEGESPSNSPTTTTSHTNNNNTVQATSTKATAAARTVVSQTPITNGAVTAPAQRISLLPTNSSSKPNSSNRSGRNEENRINNTSAATVATSNATPATATGGQTGGNQQQKEPDDELPPPAQGDDDDDTDENHNLKGFLGLPIESHESWDAVWGKLELNDWSSYKARDSDLIVYTMPGSNKEFYNLNDVQDYVRDHYSWIGPKEDHESSEEADGDDDEDEVRSVDDLGNKTVVTFATSTPDNQSTRPQDPGKPLLFSADRSAYSTDRSEYTNEEDYYHWSTLWPRLQGQGWTWKKGTGLVDYYYLKPRVTSIDDYTHGIHYFHSADEVVDYIRSEHNKGDGFEQKRGKKKAGKKKQPNRKRPAPASESTKDTSKKHKKSSTTSSVTKRNSTINSNKKSVASSKKQQKKNASAWDWWKKTPVPSDDEILPLLEKLGYRESREDGSSYYYFPNDVYQNFKVSNEDIKFESLEGLRMFLCCYGSPPYQKKLTSKQSLALERWIRFANVPVTSGKSVRLLSEVKYPDKDDTVKRLLSKASSNTIKYGGAGAFEISCGKIHLPCSHEARGDGRKRIQGVHYYLEEELREGPRNFLRGKWPVDRLRGANGNITRSIRCNDPSELALALWAACATSDLPKLEAFPPREDIEVLLDFVDGEEEDDDSSFTEEKEKEDSSVSSIGSPQPSVQSVDSSQPSFFDFSPREKSKGKGKQQDTKKRAASTQGKQTTRKKKKTIEKPTFAVFPSRSQAWLSLHKLGYTAAKNSNSEGDGITYYYFPESVYEQFNIPKWNLRFQSLQGLRMWLLAYGQPKVQDSTLADEELEALDRWIRFANIPISNKRPTSLETLDSMQFPQREAEVRRHLAALGFPSCDGKVYFPWADKHCRTSCVKPQHKVHYYKDEELWTELRDYFRGKWAIDLLMQPDDDKSSSDEVSHVSSSTSASSVAPAEKALLVWGARSPSALPILTKLPPSNEMDFLLAYSGEFEDDLEESTIRTSLSPNTPLSAVAGSSDYEDRGTSSSLDMTATRVIESSCVKKKRISLPEDNSENDASSHDDSPSIPIDPFPTFMKVIWPLLQKKLEFKYGAAYKHKQYPYALTGADDLKKYMYWNPVQGVANLDSKDKGLLSRWLSFAFIKVNETTIMGQLAEAKRLSNKDIIDILEKLGFETGNGKRTFVRPGAGDVPESEQQLGIHKFRSLEEVRSFIRGAEDFSFHQETQGRLNRRRGVTAGIDEDDLFALRVWAANSSAPIPFFSASSGVEGAMPGEELVAKDGTNNSDDIGGALTSTENTKNKEAGLDHPEDQSTVEKISNEMPVAEEDGGGGELGQLEDQPTAENEAATKIEKCVRGKLQRLLYGRILHAVVTLQRSFRCHIARCKLRALRKERQSHEAATLIQKHARGMSQRVEYGRVRLARGEEMEEVHAPGSSDNTITWALDHFGSGKTTVQDEEAHSPPTDHEDSKMLIAPEPPFMKPAALDHEESMASGNKKGTTLPNSACLLEGSAIDPNIAIAAVQNNQPYKEQQDDEAGSAMAHHAEMGSPYLLTQQAEELSTDDADEMVVDHQEEPRRRTSTPSAHGLLGMFGGLFNMPMAPSPLTRDPRYQETEDI